MCFQREKSLSAGTAATDFKNILLTQQNPPDFFGYEVHNGAMAPHIPNSPRERQHLRMQMRDRKLIFTFPRLFFEKQMTVSTLKQSWGIKITQMLSPRQCPCSAGIIHSECTTWDLGDGGSLPQSPQGEAEGRWTAQQVLPKYCTKQLCVNKNPREPPQLPA